MHVYHAQPRVGWRRLASEAVVSRNTLKLMDKRLLSHVIIKWCGLKLTFINSGVGR